MAITVCRLHVQLVFARREVFERSLAQGCVYIVPHLVVTFQVISVFALVGIEIGEQRKLNTEFVYRRRNGKALHICWRCISQFAAHHRV